MSNNSGEKARKLFYEGYNCCQATALAFADKLPIDESTLSAISSAFGGGIGRSRETCGAVSAIALVYGLVNGEVLPSDREKKTALYKDVNAALDEFKNKFGSANCGELLKSIALKPGFVPDERTAKYYNERPCAVFVEFAAEIMENKLFNK